MAATRVAPFFVAKVGVIVIAVLGRKLSSFKFDRDKELYRKFTQNPRLASGWTKQPIRQTSQSKPTWLYGKRNISLRVVTDQENGRPIFRRLWLLWWPERREDTASPRRHLPPRRFWSCLHAFARPRPGRLSRSYFSLWVYPKSTHFQNFLSVYY